MIKLLPPQIVTFSAFAFILNVSVFLLIMSLEINRGSRAGTLSLGIPLASCGLRSLINRMMQSFNFGSFLLHFDKNSGYFPFLLLDEPDEIALPVAFPGAEELRETHVITRNVDIQIVFKNMVITCIELSYLSIPRITANVVTMSECERLDANYKTSDKLILESF